MYIVIFETLLIKLSGYIIIIIITFEEVCIREMLQLFFNYQVCLAKKMQPHNNLMS